MNNATVSAIAESMLDKAEIVHTGNSTMKRVCAKDIVAMFTDLREAGNEALMLCDHYMKDELYDVLECALREIEGQKFEAFTPGYKEAREAVNVVMGL